MGSVFAALPWPSRLFVWRPYNTPTHPTTCFSSELPSYIQQLCFGKPSFTKRGVGALSCLKAKFPSTQQVSRFKVGALESAIGVTLLESQAVNAGFPTSAEVAIFLGGGAVGEDGKTNLTLTSLKGRREKVKKNN